MGEKRSSIVMEVEVAAAEDPYSLGERLAVVSTVALAAPPAEPQF
jgi:hypothetical protein